jgi:hypothetical protein
MVENILLQLCYTVIQLSYKGFQKLLGGGGGGVVGGGGGGGEGATDCHCWLVMGEGGGLLDYIYANEKLIIYCHIEIEELVREQYFMSVIIIET